MAQILTFEHGLERGVRVGVSLGAYLVVSSIQNEATVNTASNATEDLSPIVSLLGKYRDEPLWDGFEEALRLIHEEELRNG